MAGCRGVGNSRFWAVTPISLEDLLSSPSSNTSNMTKVLVLGATGYIGFAVASALARAGHEVIGQTRDVSKNGKQLQQNESESRKLARFSVQLD